MAFLAVTLLSVIARLTSGQMFNQAGLGWGPGIGIGAGSGLVGTGAGTGIGTGIGIGAGASTGIWSPTRPVNPYYNTTVTCAFTATGITGSVTLKRMQSGWGWGQSRGGLTGTLVLRTTTATGGPYNVVFTERSRIEAGCTTDGLGPVLGSRQKWGGLWGQGRGSWGVGHNSWGSGMTSTPGVVTTVSLSANQETVIDLASANLPSRDLRYYPGRGMAIALTLMTGTDGRQTVMEPIIACCKLGYDNMDAVTPSVAL